jgi:hypothetical protein
MLAARFKLLRSPRFWLRRLPAATSAEKLRLEFLLGALQLLPETAVSSRLWIQ